MSNGSSFLGKPFEPNAIIKNDTEYVLLLRKPGGYRKPTEDQRRQSKLTKEERRTIVEHPGGVVTEKRTETKTTHDDD